MLIYGKYVAILPFRRGNTISGGPRQSVSSFMINIEDLPKKMAAVVDFQFLDGYNDPTLGKSNRSIRHRESHAVR